MDNKHPKSEMPALKETAALTKARQGLKKSTETEKKHHDRPPHGSEHGSDKSK